MKFNWFNRKGLIYWPVTLIGWLIFISALGFAVFRFIAIDMQSHSVSGTLINFVFNLLLIGLVYTLIAWSTEARPKTGPTEK